MSVKVRISILTIIILVTAGGILYRLFNLTFSQHAEYVKSAKMQYNDPNSQISERGNIYFTDQENDRHIAATNRSLWYVYSNNKIIESADVAASSMSSVLGIEKEKIVEMFSDRKKQYVVIAEDISESKAKEISVLKITGVSVGKGVDRFYPNDSMAAQSLGFVGFDGYDRVGQYGVEAFYDTILSGQERTLDWLGNRTYSRISELVKSFIDKSKEEKSISAITDDSHGGDSLVLTINKDIQILAESKLEALLKKWSSPSGLIIVQEPKSGSILAMAGSPSFDPNRYDEYNLGRFINPTIQELFEPGSSFKPITMAGALDKGKVAPDTTYNDIGQITEAGFTIKNFDEKAHGTQTMSQVLEKSLNTGSIFAQRKLGNDDFLNYVVAFGFGQQTGVDMPGEIKGNISNLYSGRDINFMTASFGQGIAVTPLQLVNAYSAIANGGKLMQPYILKEMIKPDGSSIKTEPKVLGQPIAEKTSLQIKSMLTKVVDNGFDKARIPGYDVAGKTGTAQISENGEYGEDFIHSFVGFAPSYNPRFVILIKMDKPKDEKFASNTLTPTFAEMVKFLINYYQIPPTRK